MLGYFNSIIYGKKKKMGDFENPTLALQVSDDFLFELANSHWSHRLEARGLKLNNMPPDFLDSEVFALKLST